MSNHSLLRLMTVRSWPTSATSGIGSSVTAGGRRDVAKILEWQERVRGNRLAKADQDPSFGGDGVGLVEATGGGGNPFRKIPAPVVAQGLQAPALKIEVERVAA